MILAWYAHKFHADTTFTYGRDEMRHNLSISLHFHVIYQKSQ